MDEPNVYHAILAVGLWLAVVVTILQAGRVVALTWRYLTRKGR